MEEITQKIRRRREYNIEMNFMEIGWGFVLWIHLDQDRDQWASCCEDAKP
jgi:hypothetical protein